MAFTASEQELYDFAIDSLPKWFREVSRSEEELNAMVKVFDAARLQIEVYFSQSRILLATGTGETDWLNQHAKDRGTSRIPGEMDPSLRERIRSTDDALTRSAILDAVQGVMTAEGLGGTPAMVELRWDRAFFRSALSNDGTGGEFFGTAPDMEFLPLTPSEVAGSFPVNAASRFIRNTKVLFSGSSSGGNDGEFLITDLNGDRWQFQNGGGVAEVDATAIWSLRHYDPSDNLLDGFKDAYFSRGHRMGASGLPNTFIIILPFGCTQTTVEAVGEAIRQKKAGGFRHLVECRQNP